MEQNPSQVANSFSVSEEIFRILWKQQVLYYFDECSPLVPVMSQDNEI
jgi:chloramphenicol O-acetyltransferase